MKLATFEANARVSYGILKDQGVVDAGSRLGDRFPDLRSIIVAGQISQLENLATKAPVDLALANIRLLKPVPNPGKILCVGVNYPDRAAEYGNNAELPKYPSIFVRFPASLVAHGEPIVRPPESKQLDYEGEVALVIARRGRRIPEGDAISYVAGYTICNEGTIRDWLRHGKFNVTPGKNFDRTGSLGPWMVTSDEIGSEPLRLTTRVNGELRQEDTTDRMIFPMSFLISYISRFCTLEPGDLIITGSPTGAGARLDPPRYLVPGDAVEVEVSRIGTLKNRVIDEPAA
jgi:2-keto-4-pentenoate hydratase/2-oxohepta-3-ene-1,7-dioic acid hydratase in catechol pathway